MAEGRTQSVLKGQELAEALLRSLALSNGYALSETDSDLGAARASTDKLKEALAGFAAVAASDAAALDAVRSSYGAYETAINAMFSAIGQRRSGGDAFGRAATAMSTTSGAIAESMVNDGRQDGLAAAVKLVENVQAGTARVQRFVKIIEPQMADYGKAVDTLIAATDASVKASAERQKAADALVGQIGELRRAGGAQQDAAMKGVEGSVSRSRLVIGALSILALLVAGMAWRLMVSRIVVALSRLQDQMQQVARGALAVKIAY
jgi:hypothetical protein